MQRAQGFAMQGAQNVWTSGVSSHTVVQESAPYATISVYITGTTTLATLFSDNQTPPTPTANPFTADVNGYWFFYAQDGRYDVMIDAQNWTWTIGDIMLGDHTGWTSDQDAGAHWLNNLGGISFSNGQCYLTLALDPNCNLLWLNGNGDALMTLSPEGNLSVPGTITAGGGIGGGNWAGDQNANGNSLLGVNCIHWSNSVGQMAICIDQNANLVVSNATDSLVWITQEGNLDVSGAIRSTAWNDPASGSGIVFGFGDSKIPGQTVDGLVTVYDYDSNSYLPLAIEASLIVIQARTDAISLFPAKGVGINTFSPSSSLDIVNEQTTMGLINAQRYSEVGGYAPGFFQWRSRGTLAAPLPVQAGDCIFRIHYGGNVPGVVSDYGYNHGSIQAYINGPNLTQADMIFSVNDGTNTDEGWERLRITADGRVMITGSLWVNGVQVTP